MATQEERDRLISRIVRMLYNSKAHEWSVQDKGVLVGAIKLQLEENTRTANTEPAGSGDR
jgi:hypothetical protein